MTTPLSPIARQVRNCRRAILLLSGWKWQHAMEAIDIIAIEVSALEADRDRGAG